jgi:hypothetical protein
VDKPALSFAAVPVFQSVPLLARVAAVADGMTVGTAILLLTLLNPVEVAENAATLDAIAGGRFVLVSGSATERSRTRHSASRGSEPSCLSASSTSSGGCSTATRSRRVGRDSNSQTSA